MIKFLSCNSEAIRFQAVGTGGDWRAGGFNVVRNIVLDGSIGCAVSCNGGKVCEDGIVNISVVEQKGLGILCCT